MAETAYLTPLLHTPLGEIWFLTDRWRLPVPVSGGPENWVTEAVDSYLSQASGGDTSTAPLALVIETDEGGETPP
ncbi:hypothetical protein BRD56_10500 [Thermoplasmatales archaeon SW_10_69_26]|nr:MAG: hypothetical protein BRD56_10500 [Thermoplasmatales archaeon SW_10_69_26]